MPVIDHWWQTETGWAIAANPLGIERLPVKPGLADRADAGLRRADPGRGRARCCRPGQIGAICIRLPLPPGCLPTLWNADERYRQSYLSRYPGYYLTGDAGYSDEDGYLYIMSRIDDVINVAGHRLSTGGMEEVLASHKDVAECAVIGVADQLKGELPLGLVVLKAGVDRDPETIRQELVARVRDQIGPVAAFKLVAVVKPPAQDPLRQDPARHDEEDRRRQRVQGPGDDRRPGDPGRDRRAPAGDGLRQGRLSGYAARPSAKWREGVLDLEADRRRDAGLRTYVNAGWILVLPQIA